jgi:preprotein translocase subunit SecG
LVVLWLGIRFEESSVLYGLLVGFHLIVCVTLVLTVLLQAGKGGGLAGAFGGGGGAGQTLFGGRGAATFLSKATTALGAAFMVSSLVLALMSGGRGEPRSVLRDGPAPGTAPPPISSQPVEIPGGQEFPALEVGGQPTEGGGEPTESGGQPTDLQEPGVGNPGTATGSGTEDQTGPDGN